MTTSHAPRFAAYRLGRHSASAADRSPARAIVAGIAVLALAAVSFVGLDWYAGLQSTTPEAAAAPEPTPTPEPSPEPVLTDDQIFLAWGPSVADWNYAVETAEAMTVQEAAGQVLVASFSGKEGSELATFIARYNLGGVIFFDANIGNKGETAKLTAAAQRAADATGRTWPVIVSVDQEGGPVARLSPLVPEMPAFMAAGAVQDKAEVEHAYADFGADILGLGFNVNYAPVGDVTIGLADPVIRTRSAGSDPTNVANTVVAAMRGYLDAGVVPTIKHFPGHGSVKTDSHVALPIQNSALKRLVERDFVPFQAAIDSGAPMIMMGHVQVKDWGKGPSTLNPKAYSYLRDEMGFEGVIVTDALNMAAVTRGNDSGPAAVKALNAGADLLLMPADVGDAYRGIVKAVENGKLSRERLNEAAARSIALMLWQASVEKMPVPEEKYVRPFAAAGTTLAASKCDKDYVGDRVYITGGWQSERDALADALAKYGVKQGSGGTHIHILGSPSGTASADIVVAMDGPWGLEDSNAKVYVGLYGRSDASLGALADVLTNNAPASGIWPVSLSGSEFKACNNAALTPEPAASP